MELYFSQYFNVDPTLLEEHGAFDISVVTDMPLFVDPFLLFNSEGEEYQRLHEEILRYLLFLRDQASDDLDRGLIDNWYRFKEVKQNWLGFTLFGNEGAGLGRQFATDLHEALGAILADFGKETITRGSHLEKLCLISPGVGKDNISDFTTNLIKGYLCDYTQEFARAHLSDDQCGIFAVARAWFNYETKSWVTERYDLPRLGDDFVLLTPMDMLTRDETWINHSDMISGFERLPEVLPDAQLRAQVNQYFADRLGKDPNAEQRRAAAEATIRRYPELIDFYIKHQEDNGERAAAVSADKVADAYRVLVEQTQAVLENLAAGTDFYAQPWATYDECLARARFFRAYIEDNDGYKLFHRGGRVFSKEEEVQLAFGLVWAGSQLDINREVNNGRGPVDFKASYGAGDKSLIEFKLASNTKLKRNLEKQVAIYQAANRTSTSVKVIISYTAAHQKRVEGILRELGIEKEESIVHIDARADNKPSASTA